jgi:hypothetical protein
MAGLLPVMQVDSFITGRRGISLPFSDICNMVAESDGAARFLVDSVLNYGRQHRWKSVELRGGNPVLNDCLPLTRYIEHRLSLNDSEEVIYKRFKDSLKRNIKKSINEKVEVRIRNHPDDLLEFIRLNRMTRKKHGLPPQPDSFFNSIFKEFAENQCYTGVALYQDKVIAASVFLGIRQEILYKYGASDYHYQSLRANNLLMWEAIRFFKKAGYQRFSFGRTYPEHQGLMQFKNSFTEERNDIYYYKYDFRKNSYIADSDPEKSFINNLFRMMPLKLLSLIGRILYRHFA